MASIVRDALGRPQRPGPSCRLGLRIDVRVLGCHVRLEALERSPAPGALAGMDRPPDLGQLALVGGAAALHAIALLPRRVTSLLEIPRVVARLGELLLDGLGVDPRVTERTEGVGSMTMHLPVQAFGDGM